MSGKDDKHYYGGQAVMGGVMMRGKKSWAMAVRKPDGEIKVEEKAVTDTDKRFFLLKWPLVRGVAAFASSMATGVTTLSRSAEIAADAFGDEQAEPSRFEKFLERKFGDKMNKVIIYVSVAFALVLGVGLFILLPTLIGQLLSPLMGGRQQLVGIAEGLIRMAIFLGYVSLISLSKDIKRIFGFHGAEHKTINCYESGAELTADNVSKCSRLHKRCGTSFMFVVILLTMVIFLFIVTETIWLRFALRILLLPLVAGLAYEISVKWAGRHDNWLVRIVVAPGMLVQKITTAEPTEDQIETAIVALKTVLAKEEPAEAQAGA
jgi:uncharacterized protein YqhQ